MDTLKIKGALYIQKKSSKEAFFPLLNKKIILQDDTPIFQFIDNSGVDGNSIHKIRVAREILFNFEACLKNRETEKVLLRPKSLSELTGYIDENDISNYKLVLDTEDKDILSEVIQNLLYLDIDIQVMFKSEEFARRDMEIFSERFFEISEKLRETKEKICNAELVQIAKRDSYDISAALSDIDSLLMEMNRRNLKVAIMALKKSGKSVLVNCFLGTEYAPSSIELPTFNSCIYTRSKDNKISLKYQNRFIHFRKPSEVKEYILDEFRNAHADNRGICVLDDMEISYVSNDGNPCDYTIIDTPGPDLAGSVHKKIAYKWIGEADVVLFIVDYTKYLTMSEEQFFKDIKTAFEAHNKIYSFIVVVNKLDLMYLSEEKKSVVRFIDFLRSRLKTLGYSGFIVLGISALQYFYAQKVLNIKECADLNTDDGEAFRICINALLERYQGKEAMTTLSFIDGQIRNLLWFHGDQNATLKTLREKSGVEQLKKYINYIATEKAAIELFNHKMTLVDRKLARLKETHILLRLAEFKKEKDELQKKIADIEQFCGGMISGIAEKSRSVDRMQGIKKDINLADKSMVLITNIHMNNMIKQLTKLLSSLSQDELAALHAGSGLSSVGRITDETKTSVLEKNYVNVMVKHERLINSDISNREKILQEYDTAAQAKITEYSRYSKNKKKQVAAKLPRLHPSFSRFDFQPMLFTMGKIFNHSLFSEILVKKRNFPGILIKVLSLGFIKMQTRKLVFEKPELKKALSLVRENLDEAVRQMMSEQGDRMMKYLQVQINDLNDRIAEEINRVADAYCSLFDEIKNELLRMKGETEAKIGFLDSAKEEIDLFYQLWNSRIKHIR